MTVAVCISCGSMKNGSLVPCNDCLAVPVSPRSISHSLILSDNYIENDELERLSGRIKNGLSVDYPDDIVETQMEMLVRSEQTARILVFGDKYSRDILQVDPDKYRLETAALKSFSLGREYLSVLDRLDEKYGGVLSFFKNFFKKVDFSPFLQELIEIRSKVSDLTREIAPIRNTDQFTALLKAHINDIEFTLTMSISRVEYLVGTSKKEKDSGNLQSFKDLVNKEREAQMKCNDSGNVLTEAFHSYDCQRN